MPHLTAGTLRRKDDDSNNSPERMISPTKMCSKHKYNNYTRTLITMSFISLYFTSRAESKRVDNFKAPAALHECGSMDLRNNCDDFHRLMNCTAITGFLDIAYISHPYAKCDVGDYHFENLREITDFLIINDVLNLTSIKNLFPNLTVIRGRRLFINYALIMTSVYSLEKIEFKSLIAIPRGHVLIYESPKLCYTEKINWARLTLRPGQNNIFLEENAKCPAEAKCSGCKRDSCWSNDVCQKLESDSVISPRQDTMDCHPQCLGGCYNHTAQGCAVCRNYMDHGTCVENCPSDKYASSHFLRCYTREECVNKNQYIHKVSCVDSCPVTYKLNNATKECDYCGGRSDCIKICDGKNGEMIYISDIMHAEFIKGCQVLNASVVITIKQLIDEKELVESFKDVKEIRGYLKVDRSPYLTSLNFLQNLENIFGQVLEHQLYALLIYNNKNLSALWDVKPGFKFNNGGMYIHANDKLCNRHIRQFRENIYHDKSIDSVQISDQEVLCSPAKLNLYLQVLDHHSIEFFWPIDQTLDEVEIVYKPLLDKELLFEKSEIDTEVCSRVNWRRELIFRNELSQNSMHYIYVVKNLKPHTRYACLVKTFNGVDDTKEARSEIKYATTQFDIPQAPEMYVEFKTHEQIYIEFYMDKAKPAVSQVVDFYVLEVYDIPDDKKLLDTRNYCDEPGFKYKYYEEEYEDCCSRREKERADQNFRSQLKKEFACSLDQPAYCQKNQNTDYDIENKIIRKQRFEAWESSFTIRSLESFHLYVMQLKACNHAGCSDYTMASTRTNYSLKADKMNDLFACKMDNSNKYFIHFSEPSLPNGYVTTYGMHLRYVDFGGDMKIAKHSEFECITRLEHERRNFVFAQVYNYTYNQAAVRVHSLGHTVLVDWVNITSCQTGRPMGHSKAWIVFVLSVLIGAIGSAIFICYKRGYFDNIQNIFRYFSITRCWAYLRNNIRANEGVVHYRNNSDENRIFLEN